MSDLFPPFTSIYIYIYIYVEVNGGNKSDSLKKIEKESNPRL